MDVYTETEFKLPYNTRKFYVHLYLVYLLYESVNRIWY